METSRRDKETVLYSQLEETLHSLVAEDRMKKDEDERLELKLQGIEN